MGRITYENLRVSNKHDTPENWEQSELILMDGEIIFYDYKDSNNNIIYTRMKVGDSKRTARDLPFASCGITDGGEIFNDYDNNKALSKYSSAKGYNTIAGGRGFQVKYVISTTEGYDIELSNTSDIEVGDKFSFYSQSMSSNYDLYGTVKNIYDNHIIVDFFPITFLDNPTTKEYIWFPYKPNLNGDVVLGEGADASGYYTKANEYGSHSEGYGTVAGGRYAHAEGNNTFAGYASHAEGRDTIAMEEDSHAEGRGVIVSGEMAHGEGFNTKAIGKKSHSEGAETEAIGENSHAEGYRTHAKGDHSHAEGNNTTAEANNSHAEGSYAQATADSAHAEGYGSQARGEGSHAEGIDTKARGRGSHAGGINTIANTEAQMVIGTYNIEDYNAKFIIGNGSSNDTRNNLFIVRDNAIECNFNGIKISIKADGIYKGDNKVISFLI